MKTHVLDASALYRFLTNGPGADIVALLFKQARHAEKNLLMSVVNWGEVFYNIMRTVGRDRAQQAIAAVDGLPLTVVDVDKRLTREAADIRASFGLPYADCFAAALAGRNGIVVTTDAKHFGLVPWLTLRDIGDKKN